jgi:hypothetical protein
MVEWEKQFFDRRRRSADDSAPAPKGDQPAQSAYAGAERRQFADSHADLSPEAREFAQAVDRYKVERGRKFITLGEIFEIMRALGYHK